MMSEAEQTIAVAGMFAAPNEHGIFAEADCETIYAPVLEGFDAYLLVIQQADGWRAGIVARLPENDTCWPPKAVDAAQPSRADAIASACEFLIAWCADEKVKGGKQHKKKAEKLQDWALVFAKDALLAKAAEILPALGPEVVREVVARSGVALHPSAIPAGVQMIPIEELHESPWNPRQYYPEGPMQELIESMRASGYREWLPLMVRPDPNDFGYEIGAGHRRRRAAEAAGIRVIPCIVRAMTDAEFLDVLNFDNGGREDVHPLHEAAGWRAWMEKTGKGVLDIAARIGQSKEYVYQRLKYGALIPDAAKAFLDGKLTAGHAILIARQQPDVQKKALKHMETHAWNPEKISSVRELDTWLHGEMYEDLNRAPFDKDDAALLVGAGTCTACPKRAANDPAYTVPVEANDGSAVCMDAACYQQKVTNHLVRIKNEIKAGTGGEAPIEVTLNWSAKKKGVLPNSAFEVVRDGAPAGKQVKTAVVVEGENVGQVIQVRLRPAPATGGGTASNVRMTEADRAKAEAVRKAKDEREGAVRRAILDAVRPKIGGLTRADLEQVLCSIFHNSQDCSILCDWHGIKYESEWQASDALIAGLPKLKEPEIFQLLLETVVAEEFDEYQLSHDPEQLLALAKRYKVDAAKIRLSIEEPAKEAEGGTRKEVLKKLPVMGAKKAPAKKAAPVKKAAKLAPKKKGKK